MAHYLYVLQSLTLNHLETRMMAPMDCYNQASSHMTCRRENTCFCFCLPALKIPNLALLVLVLVLVHVTLFYP